MFTAAPGRDRELKMQGSLILVFEPGDYVENGMPSAVLPELPCTREYQRHDFLVKSNDSSTVLTREHTIGLHLPPNRIIVSHAMNGKFTT